MPTVPLVRAPIVGPSQPQGVRADPNMGAPLFAAQQRLASAVDDVGNLAARVKHVADTSYIIGAQAKMEAAHQDFQTWTLDHPDTSTWDEELQGRMKATTDDINDGGKNLLGEAKMQLSADLNSWSTRTMASANQMKTVQTIRNSTGVAENALNSAVSNNDAVGAKSIIDTGTKQGLWSAPHAAAMTKRVVSGIANNQVNSDITSDPFTVVEKLEAKNGDDDPTAPGGYTNYPGLPQAARVMAIARANKIATETRTATMRTWQQNVADAMKNGTQMPDEDGVRAEAARQGIAPKWVDKLFKPVATFEPGTYADIRGKIMTDYDPSKDTDGMHRATITQQVIAAHFPAQIQTELLTDLDKKGDPNHVFNSPVFKQSMTANEYLFSHEAYGKFERKVKDQKTGEFHTVINQPALRQAEAMKAHVTDGLTRFFQDNPKATVEDANKFMSGLYRGQATKTGAAIFKFNP